MIDIEADVFDAVYDAIAALVPQGNFTSELDTAPASLPHVTLYERINLWDKAHQSQALTQEFALLGYEARIDAETRTECREIGSVMDREMGKLNFLPDNNGMTFDIQQDEKRFVRLILRYVARTDGERVYRA